MPISKNKVKEKIYEIENKFGADEPRKVLALDALDFSLLMEENGINYLWQNPKTDVEKLVKDISPDTRMVEHSLKKEFYEIQDWLRDEELTMFRKNAERNRSKISVPASPKTRGKFRKRIPYKRNILGSTSGDQSIQDPVKKVLSISVGTQCTPTSKRHVDPIKKIIFNRSDGSGRTCSTHEANSSRRSSRNASSVHQSMVLKPKHIAKFHSPGSMFRNMQYSGSYSDGSGVGDYLSSDFEELSEEDPWIQKSLAEPPTEKSMENCDRIMNETFHSTPTKGKAVGKGWMKDIGRFSPLTYYKNHHLTNPT
jgi:hypothetical protein